MELRAIHDDEVPAYFEAMLATFAGDPTIDPTGPDRIRDLIPAGRALAAFDGGQIVATAATYPLTLTVPGGTVAMAGLTQVSVRPTHRRRGLLRRLIAAHLEGARAHGEPVSGLWASEAGIYGRFGYGVATEIDDLSFDARLIRVDERTGGDDVRFPDDPTVRRVVPELYARAARPGWFARSPAWWARRRFFDMPHLRGGMTARIYAVAWRDGAPTGYVAYRQRQDFTHGLASGVARIDELVATDPRAEASLWRFAAGLDLFPHVSWSGAPVDALLPWLASDPRQVRRSRADGMWLRIEDPDAALAARRYAADGVLRLAVDDLVVELRSEGGVATCARTDAAPDLCVDRAALGSIYLGAFPPSLLARTGRIEGAPAALALADRMFASPVAPWCPEIF